MENKNITTEKRDQWNRKSQFSISCIGYAVGISNIVRFPSLVYRNGGGAFLIPYLTMQFLVGIPLFYLEATLGQFCGLGLTGIYAMCPIFKGTGYGQIFSNILCVCYYSAIVSYPIRYMGGILNSKLSWAHCNNSWNTPECKEISQINSTDNINTELITPAHEFFHLQVLQVSSGISVLGTIVYPLAISLFITWVLIFFCVIRGVKSIVKVVYFTTSFPYLILFCLLIRGVTLEGAGKGILFYIKPDWSRVFESRVWLDACLQTFFSLGPGWGGIINMASFNKFNDVYMADSFIVPMVNSGTSIYAGFVVFSVLGYLSTKSGLPIDKISEGGMALAYITYPQAIAEMPFPHFWAFLFFFMLLLLGLDSVFVQLETIISSVRDEILFLQKPGIRIYISLVTCFVLFLISLILVTNGGIYIITLLELYALSIPILIYSLVINVMVSYIYGIGNFMFDYIFIYGRHRGIVLWTVLWTIITPLFLLFVLISTLILFSIPSQYRGTEVPLWSTILAWLLTAIPLSCILFYALYYMIVNKISTCKKYKLAHVATTWYPADPEIRADYFQFKADFNKSMKLTTIPRKYRNQQ